MLNVIEEKIFLKNIFFLKVSSVIGVVNRLLEGNIMLLTTFHMVLSQTFFEIFFNFQTWNAIGSSDWLSRKSSRSKKAKK